MKNLPLLALIFVSLITSSEAQKTPVSPFEIESDLTPKGKVDKLVFAELERQGIRPANLCSDEVFVRRVFVDVIGTLPTARGVMQFLNSKNPNKRRLLINNLLQRREFADYWAMKWSDLLRIKAEFPINLWPNAVQAYHRWIRTSIEENEPYDQFVREILTASGSNFRVPQVNFYRAVQSQEPEAIAKAVALTFMGVRAETWPEERLAGFSNFFSQIGYKDSAEWKEEIVFFDPFQTGKNKNDVKAREALLPDGQSVTLSGDKDPREVFADWLITEKNPWFARNIVNRIWSWLVGRGIVHEPDDIRLDNPASNPELLLWLEKEFVRSGFDLKHIYRVILNSKTYQLSSIPADDHPEAETYFAKYPIRRLDAEVLIDALCMITGTTEEYFSAIPEPFTFIPEDQRSVQLADGSVTSAFLEMFGRPPRDTGLESERNNRPTASQRLHLLNSSHIQRKIERSRKLRSQSNGSLQKVVPWFYLTILSRFPTESEVKSVQEYFQTGGVNRREAVVDLTWALMNSPEFLYRH